ncbi:hypothetical protein BDM02DRAFT_1981591 [Thelephora ganbajun]|uniref:Uncharacterized protein n=1 Tax=Thelephora ganbajun TaxID=370292 RepID=A0ACB6ZIT2_THEGA|nr:hypothetical protein BDM02DRAFT_1981591 [Thelephora ganbajun]
MRQTFVGPLVVERFFEDFLPVKDDPPPLVSLRFAYMARATSEKDMRGFFVSAANSLFTRFTAFDTFNTPSNEAEAEYKPQVTIYEREKGPPTRTTTSFQTMEMFVEFIHGDSVDPFPNENGLFPKSFNNTRSSLGQIVLHSIRQQTHQFRTSTLTVGIFGKVARFFRLDRTGCQVTAPIDYSTEEGNRQLTEFFLRLDRMADDPEARGWDLTVKSATSEEVKDFAEAVKLACEGRPEPEWRMIRGRKEAEGEMMNHPMFRKLFESVGNPNDYPRRKVSVLASGFSRDYIIGRPCSVLRAPTGRTTRGFVAMSMETKTLVFLKDSWRPDVGHIQPEDYWYQLLLKKRGGMKHIGAYLHGSDVYATKRFVRCPDMKQRTVTHIYAKELGGLEPMVGYIHHRVVQSELYLPLQTFRDSKHLTSIMYDIAKALEYVHEVGVFHRDLSIGNIMIDVYGGGRLIDFDIALHREEVGAQKSTGGGTWQFISTWKLLFPEKVYEVFDELESFFFVILYAGLHWVTHNKPETLNIKFIFDDVQVHANGRHTGGLGKQNMYIVDADADVILQDLEFGESPPFTDLIRGLFRLFRSLAIVNVYKNMNREPWHHDVANVNKLKDCKAIIRLMENAVERTDWPEVCDKVSNGNYSRKEEIGKGRPGLAYLKMVAPARPAPLPNPASAHRVPKRGREEDDDQTAPTKWSKLKVV